MHGKRLWVLATMVGLSMLLVFGVGNVFNDAMFVTDPKPNRHPAEPVPEPLAGTKEITIQVAMDADEYAVLNQLKQQYQSIHAELSLKLDLVSPSAAYASWKKAAQLGESADVLLLDNRWVTEFAALGYLTPVDSLLTSDQMSQQLQPMVNQVKWNGYTWGVPKDLDLPVVVYSAKRLQELGTDKPPAQSEELLSLHTASMKLNDGKLGLYADLEDPDSIVALAQAFGGAKAQGKAGLVKLTEPAAVKALETLFPDANGTGSLFPLSGSPSWKPWERLQQGTMLGMLTTLSAYKQHAADGLVLSALPLPKGEAVWKSGWLAGRSFVITSHARYPKEAFELIRELTNAASSVKFWNEGHRLPTVMNSYAIGGIRNDTAVQLVTPFLDKEEGAPLPPLQNRQLLLLEEGLQKLRRGELAWKSMLEQTMQLWDKGDPGAVTAPAGPPRSS